jgi:hypothetical protein
MPANAGESLSSFGGKLSSIIQWPPKVSSDSSRAASVALLHGRREAGGRRKGKERIESCEVRSADDFYAAQTTQSSKHEEEGGESDHDYWAFSSQEGPLARLHAGDVTEDDVLNITRNGGACADATRMLVPPALYAWADTERTAPHIHTCTHAHMSSAVRVGRH